MLRDTAAVDPDTPGPERPFRLADMAGPSRRRTGLIIGSAVAVAACLAIAGAVAFAATSGQHDPTAEAPPSPSPSPHIIATAVTPSSVSVSAYDAGSPAPAPRSPSQTCSDSAAWEQRGGTELIDGYINNQDTGNINVEDIKAGCPQYLAVWQKAQGGISGGTLAVPADAKPGTYETTSSEIEDCYWERSRKGRIVDNNFVTASTVKQRVTIRSTDDTFVSRGCGDWVKVG